MVFQHLLLSTVLNLLQNKSQSNFIPSGTVKSTYHYLDVGLKSPFEQFYGFQTIGRIPHRPYALLPLHHGGQRHGYTVIIFRFPIMAIKHTLESRHYLDNRTDIHDGFV